MRLFAVLAALLLGTSALVSSQGLADIAKREEERRKTVKRAGKTYTNENLKTDITASTPAAPMAANGSTPAPSAEAKDEAHWRARMNTARSALERSRIFADALQSRLNALGTDIVNRDDPAQRAQLELERNRAVAELERVKKEIAEQRKGITEIEEEARKAGLPPGWLR